VAIPKHLGDCSRVTLAKRAFENECAWTMLWRAFDKTVRRKPLYPRRHPFFKRVPTLVSIHALASAAASRFVLTGNPEVIPR
jgi:hypothetical protein